jgi:serine/threonine protein phosphatase PrpC
MNVAVSGDPASCVTRRLAPQTYLFAVASGFGCVEGEAIARNVLERLQNEMQRRARRPKNFKNALSGAFSHVNDEVHARTASHEDYITAGCSATAVLLVENRAFLAHVGSTAAYLARDGYVVSLTKNDTFEGEGLPVLTRALGIAPTLELAACSFTLNEGDSLVLAARRFRDVEERRRLAECLSYGGQSVPDGDGMLLVRFAAEEPEQVESPCESHTAQSVVVGVLATMMFYALLCLH